MSSLSSPSPSSSSPSIPSSPVSSDQLLRHRVRECCVQLHSSVQHWKQLSGKGFDITSKLVNAILQLKYMDCTPSSNVLKNVHALSSLEAKEIKERETLFTELKQVEGGLMKVVSRMGTLCGNLKTAIELLIIQGHDVNQPLFETLPPSMFGSYFEEVYHAYSQEMSLRESITNDIIKQTDRDTLTVYLSCWLHEPSIGYKAKEKLEAILIESGLR